MKLALFMVISYLMGSIPTGVIIGKKFYNVDIRNYGSKNIGATNAERVLGKKAGKIVTTTDVLKVFIPAFIARLILGVDYAAIVGICGFIGHCFPVYTKFKGGKGVATFFGMLGSINILIALSTAVLWKILKHLTKYVSISSMIACMTSSFIVLYVFGHGIAFYIVFASSIIIIYLHKANIKRLLNGTENKILK